MTQDIKQTVVNKFIKTVDEKKLFTSDTPLLIMVSGGSDSVALAYIAARLLEIGQIKNVCALHVNHKIRGEEADIDQLFVKILCDFLNIPLFEAEIDIPKIIKETGENLEACARRERYICANEALSSFCQHLGVPFDIGRIVTAHTLDDRIENFYMRSIVGTGPGGFRSMRFKSKNIVRPLLRITKQELKDYLISLDNQNKTFNPDGVIWREDITNKDTKAFRAFVRNELVPKIQTRNSKHHINLETSMELIADEDDMLDEMARKLLQKTTTLNIEDNVTTIDPCFAKSKLPLMRRAVFILLNTMMPEDVRVENSSVNAVLKPFEGDECHFEQVKNIQCNLIVSSNKNGVIIQPCELYRRKQKKI